MKKLFLPFVETMITQVCNLSCQGCSNYSDIKHSGYESWQQGKNALTNWLSRIDIGEFGIMGGEPMINPEWRDWVAGVRKLLPGQRIRFTTNGLLLARAPDILDFFNSVGDVTFKITVHTHDQQLESQIQALFAAHDWTPVTEYGISRWQGNHGVKLQINRPDRFLLPFQNNYENMAPWHSKPEEAFAVCCQQSCPLLYQGRIYKCSTSALLKPTLDRFGRPNSAQWEPYMNNGIAVDSHDQEIQEFIDNFGQVHNMCAQCPGSKQHSVNHTITVKRK
jgi:hypothetical protein